MKTTRWACVPLALWLTACGEDAPVSTPTENPISTPGGAGATNSAPVIESANLTPSVVRGGEPVSVRVSVADPNGDAVDLKVDWYVNRQLFEEGASTVLETDRLLRDSEIYAIVHASDGTETTSIQTASLRLGNALPTITGVRMLPERPTASETLIVEVDVQDREGDSYQLSYEWFVNGERVEGASDAALAPGRAKRGDSVSVRVTPSDAEEGTPYVSPEVKFSNARPEIKSKPSTTLASATGYRYEIQAEDPDGDKPLRYALIQGPEGMSVDLVSGVVEWNVPQDADGTFPIEVAVRDSYGGESRQSYSLEFHWEEVPADAEQASGEEQD